MPKQQPKSRFKIHGGNFEAWGVFEGEDEIASFSIERHAELFIELILEKEE